MLFKATQLVLILLASFVAHAEMHCLECEQFDHLDELKALMTNGVGLGKPQPPQKYNLGGMKKQRTSESYRDAPECLQGAKK